MHPELESMVKQAAPAPRGGPDVAAIMSGGRRLQTRRRVMLAGGTVAACALVATSVSMGEDAFTSRDKTTPPAASGRNSEPFLRAVEPLPYRQVYVDRVVGEEEYLVGKKRIVTAGKVLGEPWSMVEFITTENHSVEDAALCVEFFLGGDGDLGGGGNCATPKVVDPSDLVTLSGQYWGDAPHIVAVIGSIERPAVTARVEMSDGRTSELEIIRSQKDEDIGWYVFFPPPFEDGRVVAYDAEGNRVGARPICFPIKDGGFVKEPPAEGSNLSCSQ